MRTDADAVRVRHRRDFEPRRDATDPAHIDLNHVDRAVVEVVAKCVTRVDMLAERDGNRCPFLQYAVRADVIRVQRLLQPRESQVLEAPGCEARLHEVPFLIGVDHEHRVIADGTPHCLHAPVVLVGVRKAHLHLQRRVSLLEKSQRLVLQLIDGVVEPASMAVIDGNVGASAAAELLPERSTCGLRNDVPQGDVHGRLGHRRRAGPSNPVRLAVVELLPDFPDIVWITSDELIDVEAVEHLLNHARAESDGDRVASSRDRRIRLYRQADNFEIDDRLHAVGDTPAHRYSQDEAFAARDPHAGVSA